ncbi:low molecular weight protein-tyrosine-phosphatase [Emticicia sp. TH156]|uniref:low molecular weight protein-tyrosine-phosphatase n=1 Tax=Emticicia sp. TH156 TaxID=2067454 RepID=UPI000C75BD74|nr:low molecular weight protein-tyrosine-phosphatase [Emticicia sp. TH156]PLK45446.1 low molecular weight phosphotyrosine protein phosphatase [Emticicia sp. TH156]
MVKVLFVCLGNICRSPVAEGVFKDLIQKHGLEDKIDCDSAGTMGWHAGQAPDHRAIKSALNHGIALIHKGREITTADLDDFDHIVVMDEKNFKDVHALYYKVKQIPPPAEKLFLMRDYDPNVKGVFEVPDPYYGSEKDFEEVFQIVERSGKELLGHLIEKYKLVKEKEL